MQHQERMSYISSKAYEEAAADTTPPYWHTAVVAPFGDDFVLIEGLPVGNLLQFGWNLVSKYYIF